MTRRLLLVAVMATAVALVSTGCSSGGAKHSGLGTTTGVSQGSVHASGASSVTSLGPCPTDSPYDPANVGVEGIAERLVPINATRVRVCMYGSSLLDTNGVVTDASTVTNLVVAANSLPRIPPDQIGAPCGGIGPSFFVTFADAAHSVNVLGEYACAFATNGRLTMRTTPAWLDTLSAVASKLVTGPVIPLPTQTRTVNIALEGDIHGRLNSDGTCFWLERPAGGAHLGVIWPLGYIARPRPLRVLDTNGHLVGRVGEDVHLTSGDLVFPSSSRVRPSPMTFDFVEPPSTRRCISRWQYIWMMM